MNQDQAHKNVLKMFESGLISLTEAKSYHRRIAEIAESDRSDEQKDALTAIWGYAS